jgi:hypothetical protein
VSRKAPPHQPISPKESNSSVRAGIAVAMIVRSCLSFSGQIRDAEGEGEGGLLVDTYDCCEEES